VLEVRLLGQFTVKLDGAPVQINSRPAQSLLAYLLIHAGRAVRREKLAGLFWPDTSDENARNNLRQALWRVRKSLDADGNSDHPLLLVDDITVAVNASSEYRLDVIELETPIHEDTPLPRLIEIVSLYEGELLPGFYDDWVVLERERLGAIFEARMGALINRLMELQNWSETVEWSERWISLGGVPEPAYRGLMLAHAVQGDLSKMATAYRRCEEAMQNELGLAPSESTRSLYEQLKAGGVANSNLMKHETIQIASPFTDESPAPGEPPYMGLQHYNETDADYFFGREPLINLICTHITEGHPFIAIVGASGSGKSSLVRAGLIPTLNPQGFKKNLPDAQVDGGHDWKIVLVNPTMHPLEALAMGLNQHLQTEIRSADLKENVHFLRRHLLAIGQESRLLIVIDQFEELFTLCADELERRAFVDVLMSIADNGLEEHVHVVITLRADFYSYCGQYPNLREALTRAQIYIGPMSAEEVRRVIEEPARHGGWDFEPGLVELILRDVNREPGMLPLLSHALLETWRRRQGRTLTLQGYVKSGGVRGAIARTAETVFNLQLSSEQQQIAKNIFLRLTNLGEGVEGTRRRVMLAELLPAAREASAVQSVLKILSDARLITIDEDSVEVAHEALITEWPTLHKWLIEDREGLRLHRHLTEAAQAWLESDRDPSELYQGTRLSQAVEWSETYASDLSVLEQEFLSASIAQAEQLESERKAQQERELHAARELAKAQQERADTEKQLSESQTRALAQLRRRAIYLTAALFFALGMAGIALFLGERVRQVALTAQANAERAEDESQIAFSRELAAASVSNLGLDPELSILLALAAVSEAQSAGLPVPREAEEALHRSVLASRLRINLPGGYGVDFDPSGSLIVSSGANSSAIIWEFPPGQERLILQGHSGDLYGVGVGFSPDGKRVVTASADGTAKVWDVSTGAELLILQGHTASVNACIFSPDGTLIATTSSDRTVRVWDAKTGDELLKLTLPAPAGIALDPKGEYLAIANDLESNGSVTIWDIASGENTLTLPGHPRGSLAVVYNKDGQHVITAGRDAKIRVWNMENGEEIVVLDETVPIYSLALSPKGRQIAAGGIDGTVKVWDLESSILLLELTGHTDIISSLTFNPDENYLASSSVDGSTRVWDVSANGMTEWLTLSGHAEVVYSLNYSPDGRKIATSSWDETAIIWDAFTGNRLSSFQNFTAEVGRITFNGDGSKFATADYSGALMLWRADTGKLVLSVPAHSPGDIDAVFSPDGSFIGTGGADGMAKLWDANTGEMIRLFAGHTDVIHRISFDPDGSLLATASWDDTAKIWRVSSGELLYTLSAGGGDVKNAEFSPDGKLLVTAHEDGIARIWDVSMVGAEFPNEPYVVRTLVGHNSTVWDASFSPNGEQLATISFDGTVRLWDAESGNEMLAWSGNNNGPDLEFSPDGRHLAVTSGDGTVRVFILSLEELISLAKSRLTRSFTPAECQKYLRRDSCP
jgi:WD40 repeat protein/DNA-binding SARP family transcriptional activator